MKANRVILSSIVSLAATISAVLAAGPFPPAFDATYAISDNHGNHTTLHKLSDGAGHLRTETTINNQPTITIVDLTTNTVYTIMETQKMVLKGPYKPGADSEEGPMLEDLGKKTVDGRVCIGKLEAVKGGTKEVWTDFDKKIPVRTVFTGGGTTRTSDLTNLGTGAPSASNFQVPTEGYTMLSKN